MARQTEGRPLPDYVVEEFEAYLKCGILAHGFLRLKCKDCAEEKITAFSCKKRGFCPSCAARRMAETAIHLTENVLPMVPYRQFVVSFPIPLRYWLNTNKKLFSKIHKIVIDQIHGYYKQQTKELGIADPAPGSISFCQRWGSAANLNPHLHILCPDGVYHTLGDEPKFRNIASITDEQVAILITGISKKIMCYLQKQGYLDKNGETAVNPMLDELFENNESIHLATSQSIAGKIAFGPNAGKYVTKIGSGFGYGEEIALAKGNRCFSINGFSLHANTQTNTHQRDRLKKLIEYIARGPLSNERLEILENGNVKLQLKSRWSDGTTHLLFSPEEFLEKLSALIPPPKSHLVRWGGCLASNSPYRKEITLKPQIKKGFQFDEETGEKTYKNKSWSLMLSKVFKIDVMTCEQCGGTMTAVGKVQDPDSVKKYLKHLNIDYEPPPRGPPRRTQESFEFDQLSPSDDVPVIDID